MKIQKIGEIRTPYKEKAPYQPKDNVEKDEFYINLSKDNPDLKIQPPWSNGKEIGLFASRSPHRINPIGLSVVELKKIKENKIFISSLDAFDKTPLLDIKPYIKNLDDKIDANYGWIDKNDFKHLNLHIKGIPH